MDISYANREKSMKTTILFISGFRKPASTWNLTESGKWIDIETSLREKYATILVSFDDTIYKQPVPDVCKQLYTTITSSLSFRKLFIVAHSLGGFYALELAKSYPEYIQGLLLIDPSTKTDSYRNYLSNSCDPIQQAKLQNYNSLPDPIPLPAKIIVKVYLTDTDNLTEKLNYFDNFTRVNVLSDIILCPNRSHMLHYEVPAKFIAAIQGLIR